MDTIYRKIKCNNIANYHEIHLNLQKEHLEFSVLIYTGLSVYSAWLGLGEEELSSCC